MLLDYCTFIGVGQAGGNIVRELDLNDIKTFFVNTSLEDLESLGSEKYDRLYHVSGTKGMAKDRSVAKETIDSNENADIIAETIYKKYANSTMYFFVYSLSGGTGGGMTNTIMRNMKEMYPEKVINAVVVVPNSDEDMVMQSNAIECLKELRELYEDDIVTNIQILDNNKKEAHKRELINKTFSSLMTSLLQFSNPTKSGNLDEQELENTFSTKGLTIIHELSNKDIDKELSNVENNSIYNRVFRNPSTQGLILSKEASAPNIKAMIKDTFGIPNLAHDTVWDEEESIIVSTGVDFTEDIYKVVIKPIYESYQLLRQKKMKIEEEMLNQLVESDFDLNSMKFEEMPQKNSVPKSTATRRRRGRGVGVKAEMERYSK